MQIEAGPNAMPHFFMIGMRARVGQTGPIGERVGVLVARTVVRFDGSPGNADKVRLKDEAYAGEPADGPFRYEAEIAPWKPRTDFVVVDELDQFLTQPQIQNFHNNRDHPEAINVPFGTVAVDQGAGFGAGDPIRFGWRPRGVPPRVGEAGRLNAPADASSLEGFDAHQFDLPDQFSNGFFSGGGPALPAIAPLAAGHRVRFVQTVGPPVTTTVAVPPGPTLSVTENGAPLSPPLSLTPVLDTVLMDRGASEFVLVWRATFAWQARFETATLEVS